MKNITLSTLFTLAMLGWGLCCKAEAFNTQPRAGLWQSDVKLIIDGRDILAEVKAMQEQLMANLPASAREAMGKSGMMPNMNNDTLSCITPQQAADAKDIDHWLGQASQEGCDVQETDRSKNTVGIKVSCDGSGGYTGEYTGTLSVESEKSWSMTLQGKGTMGDGGPEVAQDISVNGTWISDDCGDVNPEE